MEKNYVIVGNSAAAIGCVEGIRQVDQTGSILIVSDEPYHTYSRPHHPGLQSAGSRRRFDRLEVRGRHF